MAAVTPGGTVGVDAAVGGRDAGADTADDGTGGSGVDSGVAAEPDPAGFHRADPDSRALVAQAVSASSVANTAATAGRIRRVCPAATLATADRCGRKFARSECSTRPEPAANRLVSLRDRSMAAIIAHPQRCVVWRPDCQSALRCRQMSSALVAPAHRRSVGIRVQKALPGTSASASRSSDYIVRPRSSHARWAACTTYCGVGKSGSPAPKRMTGPRAWRVPRDD
jgi:hypothetical protein